MIKDSLKIVKHFLDEDTYTKVEDFFANYKGPSEELYLEFDRGLKFNRTNPTRRDGFIHFFRRCLTGFMLRPLSIDLINDSYAIYKTTTKEYADIVKDLGV